MWLNISAKAKQLFYHTKIEVVVFHKLYLTHIFTIIAENTKNSLNSSSYTIEIIKAKIMRNSHLLSHKTGIFSSATAIVLQTGINCSYANSSKQQSTAHTSIVKRNMAKCYKHTLFLFKCTIVFTGVKNIIDSITLKYKPKKFYLQNTNYNKTHIIIAFSSHTKSSVSIDLFNLPPLPDTRKHSTMVCEIPNNFFLLDGKNTQLSKVVNTWTFKRLTPNGNEGVGIKLDYLECAYGTRYYVID